MNRQPLNSLFAMRKQVRHFVLLEVVIALALTMLLVSVLLTFYLQINNLNTDLEKRQDYNFKKLYLSTRLGMFLPKAISPLDPEKDYFFYTQNANDSYTKSGSTALVFGFKNGVTLIPEFSNHIVGRLYLDNEGKVIMATWPSPARWKDTANPAMKKEVLFENVENLAFEFYAPPLKNREILWNNHRPPIKSKSLESLKLSPNGEWKREWQQDFGVLPYLVKVVLTIGEKGNPFGKKDVIPLIYSIPESALMIVYE